MALIGVSVRTGGGDHYFTGIQAIWKASLGEEPVYVFFSLIGLFVFFDSLVRGVYVDRMQVLEVCMCCQYLLLLCDSPFDLIVSFDQQTFFILTESRIVITSFVVTLSVSCLRDACLSGSHIGGPLHSL